MMTKRLLVLAITVILMIVTAVGAYLYIISQISTSGTVRIRFGHQESGHGHYAAFFIANYSGLFKGTGAEFDLFYFSDGPTQMKAVAAGSLDMGLCGVAPVIMAIDKGIPIKIIAAANTGGSIFVVRSNLPIYNVTDLRGRGYKIVTYPPGSVQYTIFTDWLVKNGIDPKKDIDLIVNVSPSEFGKLLEAGTIDGAMTSISHVADQVAKGIARIVTRSIEMWPDHACCVLYAREDFMQKYPQVVKKVLKAYIEATEWCQENYEEMFRILVKDVLKVEKDWKALAEMSKEAGMKNIAIPSKDFIKSAMELCWILQEDGIVTHTLTENDVFDLKFIEENT